MLKASEIAGSVQLLRQPTLALHVSTVATAGTSVASLTGHRSQVTGQLKNINALDTLNFETTGGDKFGPLCGTESYSAHIYMDVGLVTTDALTLKFAIGAASTANRFWSIRVVQVQYSLYIGLVHIHPGQAVSGFQPWIQYIKF